MPILTGKWKLDTGETIEIKQDSSGKVTANFTPSVKCLSNSTRTTLFSAPLKMTGTPDAEKATLESDQFWACTRTPAMVTECGVQELFMTKFRAEVTEFGITGEVLRPHYDFEMVSGRRTNCRRNPSQDGWEPFSLAPLCRPATPWFDRDSGCQDVRAPRIEVDHLSATIFICGTIVFKLPFEEGFLSLRETTYGDVLRATVLRQIGGQVCCDKFRSAAQTGVPCDPRVDIDCDGTVNAADVIIDTTLVSPLQVPFPNINIYSSPPGASVMPFPEGLNPDDPGFVPASTGCDCKWQLIKGVLNCGTGGQSHSYVATWKCPTTGREVTTTKTATANTPCP